MPGPVSDSYDPVWGTAAIADEVKEGIREMDVLLTELLNNSPPRFILDVIREREATPPGIVSERSWRILRYAVRVALEEEDL